MQERCLIFVFSVGWLFCFVFEFFCIEYELFVIRRWSWPSPAWGETVLLGQMVQDSWICGTYWICLVFWIIDKLNNLFKTEQKAVLHYIICLWKVVKIKLMYPNRHLQARNVKWSLSLICRKLLCVVRRFGSVWYDLVWTRLKGTVLPWPWIFDPPGLPDTWWTLSAEVDGRASL